MTLVCERPLRGTETPATGTDAGYQRHWRADEPPCGPCAQAHSRHSTKVQQQNPAAHREANRRWRESNPDYFAEWRNEHPEYGSWAAMIKRCTDPNHVGYGNYGGRGITVCDRWLDSFDAFVEDMGPKPTPSHSIDRVDVNGNYEPANCRWATPVEQRANRRDCFVRAALDIKHPDPEGD